MAYSREQRRVQRMIVDIGVERGEDRREIIANLETGGAESLWRNLGYGDADSEGYRQERRRYYKNPRNLRAAINRWYDEANEFPNLRGGRLAQAVQQSAYPDRYKEFADEARQIYRRERSQNRRKSPKAAVFGTSRVRGLDLSAERTSAKASYLQNRGRPGALLELGSQLSELQDIPGGTVTARRRTRGQQPRRQGIPREAGGHYGKVFEAFYDPAGKYFDSGKLVKGAIGGHGTHVHVSASPKYVIWLGKQAQQLGLRVSENPAFDPVDPVHVSGSYHYSRRAIDVSGDAQKMARFYKFVLNAARHQ